MKKYEWLWQYIVNIVTGFTIIIVATILCAWIGDNTDISKFAKYGAYFFVLSSALYWGLQFIFKGISFVGSVSKTKTTN